MVCYKTSWINAFIAGFVLKVDYISLPNLIMGKEIIKELLQNDLTLENLKKEIVLILNKNHREMMFENYANLKNIMGKPGASDITAECIVNYKRD